jgi:SPP1 family predicted phage head-tail adaptor
MKPTATFMALRNNTFTIERRDRLDDGQGGWTIIYAPVGTVLGRICPTTSTERVIADSEEQQISHVLYTVYGENIARGDRVTCGDLAVEVLGIREPSEADHHWEIDCLERQYEEVGEVGS